MLGKSEYRIMNGYADEEVEKELGIRFIDAQPDRLMRLRERLRVIADKLNRKFDDATCTPPAKGVLEEKLTVNQRKRLTAVLGPVYAKKYTAVLQEIAGIRIDECYEKMVPLLGELDEWGVSYTYSTVPFHEACGEWAGKQRIMYVRKQVASSAAAIFKALNMIGFKPHIEDCWRPPEVQKGLLVRRIVDIARENADYDWKTVYLHAASLTAPASGFAGHQAGSAIDWQIRRNTPREEFLDAGNKYAEGGAPSCLDFPYLTCSQFRTRMIFLMSAYWGAFKVLNTENWHMSAGDRGMVGGKVVSDTVHYGPISEFDRVTGAVQPMANDEADSYFFCDSEVERIVNDAREKDESGRFRREAADMANPLH